MRTYDILADYGLRDEEADMVSLNAGCVVAVFRHKYPVTFSRAAQGSFSSNSADAITLQQSPLIIIDDIAQANVSHSKTNHVSSMNLNLRPGMNYSSELLPGDYIFCWMVQKDQTLQSLVTRLREGKPCNDFMDGLKFFGKITGCRKRFQTQVNGNKATYFAVNAAGFTEFDASMYYEPYLQLKQVGIATDMLQKFGARLNDMMRENGQGISVNKAIPILLNIFFGVGFPTDKAVIGGPDITSGADNPYSFIIPTPVAKIFGVSEGTKPGGQVAFTDILEIIHGIQHYYGDQSVDASNVSQSLDIGDGTPTTSDAGRVFQPQGADYGTAKVHWTGDEQLGTFTPAPAPTTGQQTIWSLVQQYLNPTVNEAYTCLRTDWLGKIYPTFITRQLPFSSGLVNETYVPQQIKVPESGNKLDFSGLEFDPTEEDGQELNVAFAQVATRTVALTRFVELPRWRIHPVFIRDFDLGRTDALRFNFIHVVGEAGQKTGANVTGAFIRNPPIKDDLDIARNGLRPYMRTVPCSAQDIINGGASDWMYLLSDFLMGQQLTVTGNIEVDGIQQPIVVGDNIEFDKIILHIEAVNHSFNVDSGGNKRFRTVLNVTHGVNAEQVKGSDLSLYTGIKSDDMTYLQASAMTDSIHATQEAIDGNQRNPLESL